MSRRIGSMISAESYVIVEMWDLKKYVEGRSNGNKEKEKLQREKQQIYKIRNFNGKIHSGKFGLFNKKVVGRGTSCTSVGANTVNTKIWFTVPHSLTVECLGIVGVSKWEFL